MTTATSEPALTIWVRRPQDAKPWIWGGGSGGYPAGSEGSIRDRVEELRVEYPTYEWEVRVGLGR